MTMRTKALYTGGILALALAGGYVGGGLSARPPSSGLRLVDSTGRLRGEFMLSEDDSPRLAFYDSEGEVCASLSLREGKWPSLLLGTRKSKRLGALVDSDGPFFYLAGSGSTTPDIGLRSNAKGSKVYFQSSIGSATLDMGVDGRKRPVIQFLGGRGSASRLTMFLTEVGLPSLVLTTSEDKGVFRAYCDAQGRPRFLLGGEGLPSITAWYKPNGAASLTGFTLGEQRGSFSLEVPLRARPSFCLSGGKGDGGLELGVTEGKARISFTDGDGEVIRTVSGE